MTTAIDPVELAARLSACPSVTPHSAGVFDLLESALTPLGFEVHRFFAGEAPDGPVENLFATRGSGAVDMKSAIAAFVAACAELDQRQGRISLLITGDEEGPATFGTRAIMD